MVTCITRRPIWNERISTGRWTGRQHTASVQVYRRPETHCTWTVVYTTHIHSPLQLQLQQLQLQTVNDYNNYQQHGTLSQNDTATWINAFYTDIIQLSINCIASDCSHYIMYPTRRLNNPLFHICQLVVVVVVMTSPSGNCLYSTRLWMWRDPSLRRSSWQPFIYLLTGAPLNGGCHCPQLTYCRPLSNDRCRRMSTNCQAAVGSPTM